MPFLTLVAIRRLLNAIQDVCKDTDPMTVKIALIIKEADKTERSRSHMLRRILKERYIDDL